jgi:Tfp pilus assembly protein PilV
MKSALGFSLVEVLVAMAMMTGAILLSMHSADIISSGQSRTYNLAKAQNIGAVVMEQLLSVYSNDAKLTAGAHSQQYDRNGNPATVAAPAIFTANWTVSVDTPIGKIMRIQLQVTWNENGHPHTVTYQTFRQS